MGERVRLRMVGRAAATVTIGVVDSLAGAKPATMLDVSLAGRATTAKREMPLKEGSMAETMPVALPDPLLTVSTLPRHSNGRLITVSLAGELDRSNERKPIGH